MGTINTGSGNYTLNGISLRRRVENQGRGHVLGFFGNHRPDRVEYLLTRNDTAYSVLLSVRGHPLLTAISAAASPRGS